MDHVSTDTKLKLAQMIRMENQENRMKMRSREQLVNYGYHSTNAFTGQDSQPFLGLRLRIGAAFLLFLGFLFLDYTGIKMGSIGAGDIVSWINTEVDISSFDLTETLTDAFLE